MGRTRAYLPDDGGVRTYAHEVARGYAELGWAITLFARSSSGPRRFTAHEVTVIDVGGATLLGVYARLLAAMIVAWIASGGPRAIHACTWRSAISAAVLPAPLIVAAHRREVGRSRSGA